MVALWSETGDLNLVLYYGKLHWRRKLTLLLAYSQQNEAHELTFSMIHSFRGFFLVSQGFLLTFFL